MSSAGFVYVRITGLPSIRTVGTNLVKSLRSGLTKIRPLQATYLQYIPLWYVCLIYTLVSVLVKCCQLCGCSQAHTILQSLHCDWLREVPSSKVIDSSNPDGVVCERVKSHNVECWHSISSVLSPLLPAVGHHNHVETDHSVWHSWGSPYDHDGVGLNICVSQISRS